MELKSGWLGYIDRTHEQIMAAIKSRMPIKCPEITDLTDSNPMIKLASIYAGIAELLNYYIDSNAEEVYLSTANFYESGIKIAEMLGYRPHLSVPASGNVVFMVSKPLSTDTTIPANTVLTYGGKSYLTVDAVVLKAGQYKVYVDARNVSSAAETKSVQITGEKNERIILDATDICEGTLTVTIDNVQWSDTYDFSDAGPTDKRFKTGLTIEGKPYVQFGDGSYGVIPTRGSTAVLSYLTTEGEAANVSSGVQMEISGDLGVSGISAYAENGFNGGFGYETLDTLRKNIPMVYRTRLRAITLQDFKDLIDTHASVAQSAVAYEGNLKLTGYIVPVGGGKASATLLKSIKSYMEDKIPFLTTIEFRTAGQLQVAMQIEFTAQAGYSKTLVTETLRMRMLDMFNSEHQNIRANVYLSDLYETIENTEGVKNSILRAFYITPYVVSTGTVEAEFKGTVDVKISQSTHKWEMLMYGGGTYQLTKDGKYVGDYRVGDTVSLDEMDLTVQDNGYGQGVAFEFYTYKDLITSNSVQLQEFSILTLDSKNLIIL